MANSKAVYGKKIEIPINVEPLLEEVVASPQGSYPNNMCRIEIIQKKRTACLKKYRENARA
jgi:hypothetical protein